MSMLVFYFYNFLLICILISLSFAYYDRGVFLRSGGLESGMEYDLFELRPDPYDRESAILVAEGCDVDFSIDTSRLEMALPADSSGGLASMVEFTRNGRIDPAEKKNFKKSINNFAILKIGNFIDKNRNSEIDIEIVGNASRESGCTLSNTDLALGRAVSAKKIIEDIVSDKSLSDTGTLINIWKISTSANPASKMVDSLRNVDYAGLLAPIDSVEMTLPGFGSLLSSEIRPNNWNFSSEVNLLARPKARNSAGLVYAANPDRPTRLLDYLYLTSTIMATSSMGDITPRKDFSQFMIMYCNLMIIVYLILTISAFTLGIKRVAIPGVPDEIDIV